MLGEVKRNSTRNYRRASEREMSNNGVCGCVMNGRGGKGGEKEWTTIVLALLKMELGGGGGCFVCAFLCIALCSVGGVGVGRKG